MEVCPKTFRGCELRGWDQIIEMFGANCSYQCVAQDGTTHQFTAHSERLYFSGPPPKPFVEPPPSAPHPPHPSPAQVQPAYYAPPAMGMGGMAEMMTMMLGMLKVILETTQGGGAHSQAFLLKMLADKQDNATRDTLLKAFLESKQQSNPLEFLKEALPVFQAMAGQSTTKGDNPKGFMQGFEFAERVYGSGGNSSKADDFSEMTNLFKLFTTLKAGAAPANEVSTPAAKKSKPPESTATPAAVSAGSTQTAGDA